MSDPAILWMTTDDHFRELSFSAKRGCNAADEVREARLSI